MASRALRGHYVAAAATAVLVSTLLAPTGMAAKQAAHYLSNAQLTGTNKGLDSACDPSLSQMQAFWNQTPYYNWFVYIGGSQMYCRPQPNLSTNWFAGVTGNLRAWPMKYDILPLWVGLQAPCNVAGAATFSTNAAAAYSQGEQEAISAYNTWVTTYGQNAAAPIAYDLEAFTSPCNGINVVPLAQSFIAGWDYELSIPPAQTSGVYGSTCSSYLDSYASISPVPAFIYGALYDSNQSTSVMSCVSSSHWTSHQRHKQYTNTHDETYNGVTLSVDNDCANGPLYGLSNGQSSVCQ